MEITYKRKTQPHNTYAAKLAILQAMDSFQLSALCRELGVPFLLSAAPRLLTRRLENSEGYSRVCDSILRKPILHMPLPGDVESLAIVTSVVLAIAHEKGIDPADVNIPKAIPDSFGFYEEVDPACNDCPYKVHCQHRTKELQPTCYRVFYNSQSAACGVCLYAPWCRGDLLTNE